MRVEERDGSLERRILIGMIVDTAVLGRIAAKWEPELMQARWSNIIGQWCVDFYQRYGKAPKKEIEPLYESWASSNRDKDTVAIVERFLDGLSGEYASLAKDSNSDYLIDQAGEHFNSCKLKKMTEAVQGDLESGKLDKALARVSKYGAVEMGGGTGVDVLLDRVAVAKAFAAKQKPIITYPGALGEFFGDVFERDSFVVFAGPEKVGKTWCLLDVAWRAMLQGKRVAFFEVGDMSQDQMMLRFMVRASGRPLKPGTIKYPKFIEHDVGAQFASVDLEEKSFKRWLNEGKAWAACQAVTARNKEERASLLRLSVHPNDTLSVGGMTEVLQRWGRSGWTPDIIVVDYADILAGPPGMMEGRDKVNSTWKALRSLSQVYHCCLVTATQTDAASYGADLIGMKNFSEDKRKWSHVTAAIGINQSKNEKKMGLRRYGYIVLRESDFDTEHVVHVAGCLALANPAIKACF